MSSHRQPTLQSGSVQLGSSSRSEARGRRLQRGEQQQTGDDEAGSPPGDWDRGASAASPSAETTVPYAAATRSRMPQAREETRAQCVRLSPLRFTLRCCNGEQVSAMLSDLLSHASAGASDWRATSCLSATTAAASRAWGGAAPAPAGCDDSTSRGRVSGARAEGGF